MATLREIAAEYRAMIDVLIEAGGEIDEELARWDASLRAGFAEKVDGYCDVIAELSALATARKAEADRLAESARFIGDKIDRLMTSLLEAMRSLGVKKHVARLYTLTVCNNSQAPVELLDAVPEAFLLPPKPREPDMRMIRDALKSDAPIGFAKLGEVGQHLRIR